MNNEVLEKMLQFLNQLRCEQKNRKSTIKIPGLKEREKEMELLLIECEKVFECLSWKDKQKIEMFLLSEWHRIHHLFHADDIVTAW